MKNKDYNENTLSRQQDNGFSIPPDTLQSYYKDAYMKERERFNSMFGTLDYNPPYEEPICKETQQQEQEEMVSKKKYKKAKGAVAAFVVLTVVFLASTAFFAAKFFELI